MTKTYKGKDVVLTIGGVTVTPMDLNPLKVMVGGFEVSIEALKPKQFTAVDDMPRSIPVFQCMKCGCQGNGFYTIEYQTDWGMEYDLECPECGSTNVEEA